MDTENSKNIIPKQVSLAHKVLLKMGRRITVIIVIATLASYWYVESILEQQILEQLTKYVGARGAHESVLFKLAEQNQQLFREEFLTRYQANLADPEKFAQFFVSGADGSTRLYQSYYFGTEQSSDSQRYLSSFISPQTPLTPEFKHRLLTTYKLITQYAPAWSRKFTNFYANYPENAAVLYWPNTPWGLDAPADFDVTRQEYFYIADEQHNPQHNTVWTGSYYDEVAKKDMVSCETPVYFKNKLILVAGTDILLTELLERTLHSGLEGTQNIIFRQDGRLIAHPEMMEQIEKSGGNLGIQNTDNNFKKLFERIKTVGEQTMVLRDPDSDAFIGVTRIQGPDWYFVTIYPKSLLEKKAFSSARFILLMGMLSLIFEVVMLFWILNRQITNPLNGFIASTAQLAGGRFDSNMVNNLPTSQSDEIGKLARAFLKMASALKTAFESLENKNAELQEKENRYRTLFNNSNDAILILEGEHFVDCNLKSLALFQCSRTWIIGETLQQLSPPEQADTRNSAAKALEYIRHALAGEAQCFEWTHTRRNGNIFDAEISINKVSFNHQTYLQVIIRDITERKQMELSRLRFVQEQEAKNAALRYNHEIESKNQELLRANQEKNEFLGIAVHDLKNPLSGILGLAEIMSCPSDPISLEERLEYSGMIASSAKQMFDLITNLLDVNKIESGKFDLHLTQLDLQVIIEKIISSYHARAQAKQITIHFSHCAALAYLDPNITQQVLDNLISNAVKYSPEGKNIDIRLSANSNSVRCEIQDEGVGLSLKDQEKLFGKFTRLSTKPTGGEHSTGLGLFIVKKLVTALNGKVWCESELGQGATFIVEFPSCTDIVVTEVSAP